MKNNQLININQQNLKLVLLKNKMKYKMNNNNQ